MNMWEKNKLQNEKGRDTTDQNEHVGKNKGSQLKSRQFFFSFAKVEELRKKHLVGSTKAVFGDSETACPNTATGCDAKLCSACCILMYTQSKALFYVQKHLVGSNPEHRLLITINYN